MIIVTVIIITLCTYFRIISLKYDLGYTLIFKEARGIAFGGGSALQVGRWQVRFQVVSFGFFVGLILSAALWSRD
jgi:hypothetical protein